MRENGRIELPVKRQMRTENVEELELANNHFSVLMLKVGSDEHRQ